MSRCTEKILTQLEVHANLVGGKEDEEELLMDADRSWTCQVKSMYAPSKKLISQCPETITCSRVVESVIHSL